MSTGNIQNNGVPQPSAQANQANAQQEQLAQKAAIVEGIAVVIQAKDVGKILSDASNQILIDLSKRKICKVKIDTDEDKNTGVTTEKYYLDDGKTIACVRKIDPDKTIHSDHLIGGKKRLHVDYKSDGSTFQTLLFKDDSEQLIERAVCDASGIINETKDKNCDTIKKHQVQQADDTDTEKDTTLEVDENDEDDFGKTEAEEKQAEKDKIKSNQWKPTAIAAAAVALAIIGVCALSFAAASLIVGFSLLELSIAVIVAGGAFTGTALTIYFGLIRPAWSDKIKKLNES